MKATPIRRTGSYPLNTVLIVIYLLLISNALIAPLIYDFDQEDIEGSLAIKIAKFVPIIFLIMANPKLSLKRFSLNMPDKILIGIGVFYLISTAWSSAKTTTLGDALQFAFFLYTCYYLCFLEEIGRVDMMAIFRNYVIIICGLSLVFYIVFPQMGRMTGFHNGLARGIFLHKNILASTIVTFLPIALVFYWKRLPSYLLFAFMVGVLFLTRSSTSFVATALLVALSLIIRRFEKVGLIFLIPLVGFMIGYVYFNYSAQVLHALGKSEDLTGRVTLWDNIVQAIDERPMLGYGYWGFWNSSEKGRIFSAMKWTTGKSHNAFLDVLLNGGFVLLVICVIYLVFLYFRMISIKDRDKRSLALLTLFGLLTLGMAEIGIFEHNNINLLFLIYASRQQ